MASCIFIFGEVLITNISLDITIYSTFLINLSFFIHCFFHNTDIIQVRAAAMHILPLLPLLSSYSSFPSVSEQNGGPKKALKPPIRGTEGV